MEYENLIEFYSNKIEKQDDFCLVEMKMINRLIKLNNWNKLTNEEKQINRDNKFNWLVNKVYIETKLPDFVLYELAVNEFYKESILTIKLIDDKLKVINDNISNTYDELLLVRLYTILRYTNDLINSHYEIKKNHIPLEIIENIINKCLSHFKNYNLNELNFKFLKVKELSTI